MDPYLSLPSIFCRRSHQPGFLKPAPLKKSLTVKLCRRVFQAFPSALSGLQVVLGEPRKAEGSPFLSPHGRRAREPAMKKGGCKFGNLKSETKELELPSCRWQGKWIVGFWPCSLAYTTGTGASRTACPVTFGDISFSKMHSCSKFTLCSLRWAFIHSLAVDMIPALEKHAHRREDMHVNKKLKYRQVLLEVCPKS